MTENTAETMRLADVIGALSYALDLTEGQPPGHCQRGCLIGMAIGDEIGVTDEASWDLYYTLLLKDAGCSSNAARLCELYGADDIATKRDVKTVDVQSVWHLGRFVLTHTGVNAGFWRRAKLLWNLLRNGERLATEVVTARCERGAEIARELGFNERVASGIRSLDEHWNGKGRPDGLRGEAIPLASRISLLAQVVDVFHQQGGPKEALAEVRSRRGTWFDPDLVDAFEECTERPGFWLQLRNDGLDARVRDREPSCVVVEVDEDRLDAIAAGFGKVIDAKSPFTSGHSARVADYCVAMARHLGLSEERVRWIRRAGLLHDIGKLGISNTILDKPGKLTEDEWEQVRKHPIYTHRILSRLAPFAELALVSGAHHERLDGTGYPWGLDASAIAIETRIVTTADIFDAISADRPYRAGMPFDRARKVMEELRGSHVDPQCLDALWHCLPAASPETDVMSVASLIEQQVARV